MASSSTNVARTPPLLHILSDFDGTIIHEVINILISLYSARLLITFVRGPQLRRLPALCLKDTLIDLVGHSPRFRSNGGKKAAQKAAREIMLQVARQSLTYRGAFDMICGIIEGVEGEEGVEVMVRGGHRGEWGGMFMFIVLTFVVPADVLSLKSRRDFPILCQNHVLAIGTVDHPLFGVSRRDFASYATNLGTGTIKGHSDRCLESRCFVS